MKHKSLGMPQSIVRHRIGAALMAGIALTATHSFLKSSIAYAQTLSATPGTPPNLAETRLYRPAGARAFDFWYAKSGTTYHAFYLRAEAGEKDGIWSVGHATGSDLVRWTEEGVVLRADPEAPWCNRSIATGSTWRGPTRWQMLVTAHGGIGGNLGLAESDDLKQWEMVGPVQIDYKDHVVPTDPAWQRHGLTAGTTIAYRILADPYVLPDPVDGWWYMVANCAVEGRAVNQRGCVGLLRSKDGRRWEDCGIIGLMLDYDRPETPQLWQHGDRWYLYFGGAREGSQFCRHNRLYIARSMRGLFEPAPQSHIALPDGRRFYIAKVLADPQAHGLKMGTRLGAFWCDPKGRLWLFFHQSVGMFDGSCSNWFVRCDDPDAETPVWTEPVYIGFGASLNKPIVRQNGEWILPVSLWERWHIDKPFADCYHELDAVRGANVFVSDDEGRHWRYRGGIIFKESCFNEHTVVELQDGRLRMLSRGMKEALQSFSNDGGKTWQPQSTAFPHVNSKCVMRRLQSGAILLIRHGQDISKATPARQELTAFLWLDHGNTWSAGLLLDERTGVSYPDIAQAPNGDIYVHYDRNRNTDAEILFARFREEDVKAGNLVSSNASLKNLVKSRLGMNRGQ